MKLKTTLLAATLATFAASAPLAYADHHMGAKEEAAKEKPADTKKTVKKHSHMTEKTGMPASETKADKSHRETMPKDMPMHDHTKDKH